MRSTFFFAALLIVVAVASIFVARGRDSPSPAASHGTITLVAELELGVSPR